MPRYNRMEFVHLEISPNPFSNCRLALVADNGGAPYGAACLYSAALWRTDRELLQLLSIPLLLQLQFTLHFFQVTVVPKGQH